MLPYKCRLKYWSEIKEIEDKSEVKFHKLCELSNHINDLADIEFPKDIIVNFYNNGSLFNDGYI